MGLGGDFIFPPKSPMPQIGPNLQYNGSKCRQNTAISRGASCNFVSRRKCVIWRLLAILRFAHDRPMLQIGPNLRCATRWLAPLSLIAGWAEHIKRVELTVDIRLMRNVLARSALAGCRPGAAYQVCWIINCVRLKGIARCCKSAPICVVRRVARSAFADRGLGWV